MLSEKIENKYLFSWFTVPYSINKTILKKVICYFSTLSKTKNIFFTSKLWQNFKLVKLTVVYKCYFLNLLAYIP